MSTDRAGQAFRGRELPAHPFAGDDGSVPAPLAAALARYVPDDDAAETRLVAAVAASRLILGVLPVPGESDAHEDMATITLTAPDGQRALPVFSSVAALAAWRSDARPMPVSARDAAQGAVQEGAATLVLDLGGAEIALRPTMVRALMTGEAWHPGHLDPEVRRAVAAACTPEEAVAWHELGRGRSAPGAVVIELGLVPGLDRDAVMAVARRVAERLAADEAARSRMDGVEIGLRKA